MVKTCSHWIAIQAAAALPALLPGGLILPDRAVESPAAWVAKGRLWLPAELTPPRREILPMPAFQGVARLTPVRMERPRSRPKPAPRSLPRGLRRDRAATLYRLSLGGLPRQKHRQAIHSRT